MEKRQRRKFTDEFKAKAVQLVQSSNKTVAEVARDLDLTAAFLRQGEPVRFAFIRSEKAKHGVPALCRMLPVSKNGYYAWCKRGPSLHALEDARLGTLVVTAHREGRGAYGSPRVLRDACAPSSS